MESYHNPFLYLFLQKRILELPTEEKQIERERIEKKIKHIWIPKKALPIVIKELENMGLIKRINKNKIEVINYKECLEIEQINKIYHKVGMW